MPRLVVRFASPSERYRQGAVGTTVDGAAEVRSTFVVLMERTRRSKSRVAS